MPNIDVATESNSEDASVFIHVTEDLNGKIICGMDIGGKVKISGGFIIHPALIFAL